MICAFSKSLQSSRARFKSLEGCGRLGHTQRMQGPYVTRDTGVSPTNFSYDSQSPSTD